MSAVSVQQISKYYQRVTALDAVSIDFRDGEFFALLGPSGSGKTTLLRCIAGFVTPDRGEIRFDGRPVENVPVHKRDIGMVFQNYALFPHMNVFDNIGFGLAVRGVARRTLRERVEQMLALVRLQGFADRKPRQLSGGQQQRVALARALITQPRVLLLDEPLGALDRRLRQEMQIELKQIQREVGLTTLFVTHDQEEALTLSDRIAIINHGKVVQIGAPNDIYERPLNAFAASFLGSANFFEGEAADQANGAGRVRMKARFELFTSDPLPAAGTPVTLAVRPEKILLLPARATIDTELQNRLTGRVRQLIYSGSSTTYIVDIGAMNLMAFEQNRAVRPLAPGTEVIAAWAAQHSVVVAS